jgi:uncharacterized protein DUF4365
MNRKADKDSKPKKPVGSGGVDDVRTNLSDFTPKEIGREAGKIFATSLPANWAIRPQEDQEDYGVDYEIEVINASDQATGFIFKIQQKGMIKARRVNGGKLIAYSGLERKKLEYYMSLRIPVAFCVVDITRREVCWQILQGNDAIQQRLNEAAKNKKTGITIHLPTSNLLPATAPLLLRSIRQAMNAITISGVTEMSQAELKSILSSPERLQEIDLGLRMAQFTVRSAQTQQLIRENRLKEAVTLNKRAFEDEGDPVESRFFAAMEILRLAAGIVAQDQVDPGNSITGCVALCNELVRLTRRLAPNERLRHYAIFLAHLNRMRLGIYHDIGIVMSRSAQLERIDEYTKLTIASAQQHTASTVLCHLRRLQRRMTELLQNHWFELAFHGWYAATEALGIFLLRLRSDNLSDAAVSITRWLDLIGQPLRIVAEESRNVDAVGLWALNHVRIGFGTESVEQRTLDSRQLISKLQTATDRENVSAQLDQMIGLSADIPSSFPIGPDAEPPSTPPKDQELEQMARQMARSLGIDLDNPNDETAKLLRVGLKDYNPERVLRECQHLYVRIDSYGIPAQLMGLPTAGRKEVCCTKHGYRTNAFSLDVGYAHFKEKRCAKCPDSLPHPVGWKWNQKYQQIQFETHDARWSHDIPYTSPTTKRER